MNYIISGNDHILVISNRIEVELHKHKFIQLAIGIDELLDLSFENEKIRTRALLIKSNVKHLLDGKGKDQILILFDPTSSVGMSLNELVINDYRCLDEVIYNQMIQLSLELMAREFADYQTFYDGLLQVFDIELPTIVTDDRIIELISYLKSCDDMQHNIEDLARLVHLSKSRLSHLFKEETGLALSSYIQLHKLQKALEYVLSDVSITEAALTAGFDSPSHLASICKSNFGLSAKYIKKDSVFLKV